MRVKRAGWPSATVPRGRFPFQEAVTAEEEPGKALDVLPLHIDVLPLYIDVLQALVAPPHTGGERALGMQKQAGSTEWREKTPQQQRQAPQGNQNLTSGCWRPWGQP